MEKYEIRSREAPLTAGARGGRVNGDEQVTAEREEEEWMKKQEDLSYDGIQIQPSGWANQMPRETKRKKKDVGWQKLSGSHE